MVVTENSNFATYDVTDDGARILGVALAAMPRPLPYESIDLYNNNLTGAGMEAVARGMRGEFSQLRNVAVGHNEIGDAGFAALAAALPPTLKDLDMDANQCDDVGMVAVVEALSRCTELDHLDCCCNSVGAAGFAAVAEALPRWPKLEYLIVTNNPGPADALALALIKAVEAGVAFRMVLCRETGLSEAVHQQLRVAFEASGNDNLECGD
jgi:Ran GTPase-activating protein (RanGAP) involved in mRNA processing and transport